VLNLALSLGSSSLTIGNLLSAHPSLIQELGGEALAHVLYSYVRRAGHRRKRNRRHIRKTMNRRRRWFVDNIIMHHRRIHERNRELVVTNARSKVLARRETERKKLEQQGLQHERDDARKWRDAGNVKHKIGEIRGRIDARKMRARSRWVSVKKSDDETNSN